MTRTKALVVASILAVGILFGATAASAGSTSGKKWCAQYGANLPANSLATPLICPTSKKSDARPKSRPNPLNGQIALAINNFRRAHGLVPLRISAQLNASARQHSQEMGADGYFEHDSANGTVWWKRILHYYPMTHYRYWTVGENLLFASPNIAADAAMKLWIASPEHLRNLMDPNWRNLGVSAVHVNDAGGVYGGNPVTIITTDFGARH